MIAPIGVGEDGQTYNINADTAAGAIAAALSARKLIMLTDVEGVLDRDRRLISELSAARARALIADGTVSGGMIPKLETCLRALADGVGAAHVLDGRLPHVLLLETFTEAGVGTKLTPVEPHRSRESRFPLAAAQALPVSCLRRYARLWLPMRRRHGGAANPTCVLACSPCAA